MRAAVRSLLPPLLLLGPVWLGCAGLPGFDRGYLVVRVVERAGRLDAVLEKGDERLRFFFPAEGACARIVRAEAWVEYTAYGPLGRIRAGDDVCDPVGIASLRAWRDRRPRPQTPRPVPRARAEFAVIYEDADYVLARGRFPLAGLVGWYGGDDTIALVPRTDACALVLARGVASMEYRPSGPQVFTLLSDADSCPIEGFVLPESRPRAAGPGPLRRRGARASR